jgi:large subunit ribosomal protein L25
MSDKIALTAEIRTDVGKGASRRLRRSGEKVPAIIYGAEDAPQNLTLAANELSKAMQQEAFYSQILDVLVDGQSNQAVVRDLQRNPASGKVLHIDFQRVSANKPINVNVPLHFINEEQCVGVKISGGIISHNLTEVEISCLPADLPEYIEVDMKDIDLGFAVHLSGLALPAGVTIIALTHGDDHDIPVVAVNARRGGAEEEEVLEAEAETEAPPTEDSAEASESDSDEEE